MNKKRAQVSHERTPERFLRRTPKIHKGIAEGDGERKRSAASKREREREAKETRKGQRGEANKS